MIDTELRAQMIAYTAADAPPPDLLRRVHSGVRRTQSRRIAVVGGVAVAASVAGVSLAAGSGGGPAGRSDVARQAQVGPTAPAPQAVPVPGPSDDELRAAEWFSYESQPNQPGDDRAAERRWESRDGRHLAQQPDGSIEVYNTESVFPFGADGVSFDELLALPADPAELDRRMREATGGRPDDERVLDQVKQLLGRSPALTAVRRALVDAAVRQEGVTLVDGAEDSQGRPALLLEHTDRDGAILQLWIDPAGYRLLEERTVAGPDFPTPPTEGPRPPVGDGQELRPGEQPEDAPVYEPGQLLYAEVFLSWSTTPPPGS